MSIFSSPVPSGLGEASSFFETFVPRVWIYLSSKLSRTNRRMREVLPTAASPMRQTFTFILLTSINIPPGTGHTRHDPLNRSGRALPQAKPKALLRWAPPFLEHSHFPPRDARLSPKS